MTTLGTVTKALENRNFKTNGVYSELPKITYNLIIKVLNFGESQIEKSTLGKGVKELVLELARLDGRKSIVCPVTFKNILV